MKNDLYALLDCNNFYASCERVFNPSLKNRPMVILSNNDGCVIARSNEAKAIGIPMGVPYFKCQRLIEQSQTVVFSSNYALYGDMSARVMSLLPSFTPEFEVYSIDEAFLKLNTVGTKNYFSYAVDMRQHVLRCTGLPVSIGIAATKTLSKVANVIAKKKTWQGVFEITPQNVDEVLATLAVEDIWGVGINLGRSLRKHRIHSALDLKRASPIMMRRQFNVVMEKMVHELNGHSCLALEEVSPKKNITSSRSFGMKVKDLTSLKEAIAYHCANAAVKLRDQGSAAQGMYVFIKTSKHDDSQVYSHLGKTIAFESPLYDTSLIIAAATQAVENIFQPHLRYYKAGIILLDLVEAATLQQDIFSPSPNREGLMEVLDEINQKYHNNLLFYAAEGLTQSWQAKRGRKSLSFTTNWKELPIAYAC